MDIEITNADLPFEKDILHDKYNIKNWLRYIEHKKASISSNSSSVSSKSIQTLITIYERAVKALPGSYKLWKQYLDYRKSQLYLPISTSAKTTTTKPKNPLRFAQQYEATNYCYERALLLLHKMPRIWLDYLEFRLLQPQVTQNRRTFDRALRALPVTQHDRIWPLYLKFAQKISGITAIKVYTRYLQLYPEQVEEFIELCVHMGKYGDAAKYLLTCLDNAEWKSPRGTSKFQLWMKLTDLIIDQANDVKNILEEQGSGISCDLILRDGIKRYSDQAGKLWTSLAKYYIITGEMERARDVFEEAVEKVKTVRDFVQVFDAYAEFEEGVITSLMEMEAEQAAAATSASGNSGKKVEAMFNCDAQLEVDMRLERFEKLMDRRPFLISDVLLRQNPNSVKEWQKRAKLWKDCGNVEKMVETYEEAVNAVQPRKAGPGKLSELWIEYAKYYDDDAKDIDKARDVLYRGTRSNYKTVAELVDVWLTFAEMEMKHENYDEAINVLSQATSVNSRSAKNIATIDYRDEDEPPQTRVCKSLKLWSLYVDLEESIGTLETTKAAYDRILELKIATPQTIVNYAQYLEEKKYFEDSFRVYERGIELFGYPVAFELWNIYLAKFIDRYGETKLERSRELFEQAIKGCPPKYAKPIYLLYGKLEEVHGQTRHAMRIYELATTKVAREECLEMYRFYIAKVIEQYGLTSTRQIYEKALETLPDHDALLLGLDFAKMELQLGEIDRARGIYAYSSQFADPRLHKDGFWKTWDEFEIKHGNEDTYREMLRIKRTSQAKFNTESSFISAQVALGLQKQKEKTNKHKLVSAAASSTGIDSVSVNGGDDTQKAQPEETEANPDEMELDDDDL
ncbi:pre-mRNA-splicing factor syf1 [Mycoemilia scoparia]|uniref:Pre-mRNA-splicing factor SYF1 n=1 Tax=Mycoemilia scoparia TaxID=417184 RepID=A0A9W7ZMZ9_9FUNG|nr:pre-mRNA-splicing factor syf1 [Mycoemilia scoparia]